MSGWLEKARKAVFPEKKLLFAHKALLLSKDPDLLKHAYYLRGQGTYYFSLFRERGVHGEPAPEEDMKIFLTEIETLSAVSREEAAREDYLRALNIDPGYLTLAKVVLASTKNHAHRLILSKGIYGELTLSFRGRGYQAMPWTYPDYRREDYLEFFCAVRAHLADRSREPGSM